MTPAEVAASNEAAFDLLARDIQDNIYTLGKTWGALSPQAQQALDHLLTLKRDSRGTLRTREDRGALDERFLKGAEFHVRSIESRFLGIARHPSGVSGGLYYRDVYFTHGDGELTVSSVPTTVGGFADDPGNLVC